MASQNGLGWREPQRSASSNPCHEQGNLKLEQVAQVPWGTILCIPRKYWTSLQRWSITCIQHLKITLYDLQLSGTTLLFQLGGISSSKVKAHFFHLSFPIMCRQQYTPSKCICLTICHQSSAKRHPEETKESIWALWQWWCKNIDRQGW